MSESVKAIHLSTLLESSFGLSLKLIEAKMFSLCPNFTPRACQSSEQHQQQTFHNGEYTSINIAPGLYLTFPNYVYSLALWNRRCHQQKRNCEAERKIHSHVFLSWKFSIVIKCADLKAFPTISVHIVVARTFKHSVPIKSLFFHLCAENKDMNAA
jgi:hypothetical protein